MAETIRTGLALGAVVMIGVGAGMIYLPAGLIVAGFLVLAGCVAGALRSKAS